MYKHTAESRMLQCTTFTLLVTTLFLIFYSSNPNPNQTIIHVFIPHYKNLPSLVLNLKIIQDRQSFNPAILVKYTVFTQEDTPEERDKVRKIIGTKASVVDLPQPGKVGGDALFKFFKEASKLAVDSGTHIAVTSDVDAFILANGWDSRLYQIFCDKSVVLAGISPRFNGTAEWNWMAFSPRFFSSRIDRWESLGKLHDWGHWFTKEAKEAKKKQHLWERRYFPFPGKSPTAVGDDRDKYWALHTFYGTRRTTETLFDDYEKNLWVTQENANRILEWVALPNVLNIEDFFESQTQS